MRARSRMEDSQHSGATAKVGNDNSGQPNKDKSNIRYERLLQDVSRR